MLLYSLTSFTTCPPSLHPSLLSPLSLSLSLSLSVSLSLPLIFTQSGQALFQLKFGPVVRCSRWYEEKVNLLLQILLYYQGPTFFQGISTVLERDIKTAIVNAINSHCQCGFQQSSIDLGEFSCQSTTSTVIYRLFKTSCAPMHLYYTNTVYISTSIIYQFSALHQLHTHNCLP